jgi:hypothetical protein
MDLRMRSQIDNFLTRFALHDTLQPHVADVLAELPEGILRDFLSDPDFMLCDYEPGPNRTMNVPIQLGGRTVILKRTLRSRPREFIRWVIAHELAHAHLRNAGRYPGEDPERAADALAATWGFPRPAPPV